MSDIRYHGLDALRGIAAIAVVIFHYSGGDVPVPVEFPGREFLSHGVELFFCLSGFVIAFSLSNSGGIRQFAIRRFYRLYPMFWACCVTTWVWVSIFGLEGRETGLRDLVGSMTMIPTLLNITLLRGHEPIKAVDGVYWSLTCELLFYILAASLWKVLGKSRMLQGFTLWVVVSVVLKLYEGDNSVVRAMSVLLNAKWAAFFYAGIVLQAKGAGRLALKPTLYLLAGNCVLTLFAQGSRESVVLAASSLAIAIFARSGITITKYLAWLGAISYPLYLLHQNIGYSIHWEMSKLGSGVLATWIISVSASLLLAHAMHRFIDNELVPKFRRLLAVGN
jgi:peptidoglycan/LPS O-acetylase OafA/YrhL